MNNGGKRERLTEAAKVMFYQQGVTRTTLADIAQEIRRTTLWQHQQKELESSHWRSDSCWPAAQSVRCSSSSCFSSKGPLAPTTAPGTTLSARSARASRGGCKSATSSSVEYSCSALP